METNNLTPSEKLKRRIYFTKDGGPNSTADVTDATPDGNTLHALDNTQEDPVVYGETLSDEEFSFTGAAIIYLFTYLALLSIIAIVFCLTYYK